MRMSIDRLIQRLAEEEARRCARWLLIISVLWLSLWGAHALFFSRPADKVSLSEIELLAEEAHFYPIDL